MQTIQKLHAEQRARKQEQVAETKHRQKSLAIRAKYNSTWQDWIDAHGLQWTDAKAGASIIALAGAIQDKAVSDALATLNAHTTPAERVPNQAALEWKQSDVGPAGKLIIGLLLEAMRGKAKPAALGKLLNDARQWPEELFTVQDVAEVIRNWAREGCHVPPPPAKPAIVPTKKPPSTLENGVAPRNRWFMEQHQDKRTETYHSHAKIRDMWNGMTKEQQAAICPDGTGIVTRQVVIKGVARARQQLKASHKRQHGTTATKRM
jgi:hypothetical protein